MHLDITVDQDAESMDVIYDDQMVIQVYKNSEGKLVYSKNLQKIEEEYVQDLIRSLANRLLNQPK